MTIARTGTPALFRRILPIALTFVLLPASGSIAPASAAVPSVINYQGRLTDNSPQQAPVSGTPTMEFSIWDALIGGSSLWSETQSVQVTGGLFNVMLGQVTPIPPTVFSGGAERWLEVRVSGETLAPRQRIAATAFANVAAKSDDASGLGGLPAASWQQRIANACPAGFAINSVAADGTVTCVQPPSPGCLGGDCRTSWNNPDSNSVSPMPRSCPAGQVAMSLGPFQWGCATMCIGGFYSDCNGNPLDGCETPIAGNVDNCGGCGFVCSTNNIPARSCSNGVCDGACAAGFGDCNANKRTDGCETNIAGSNPDNCGGCGVICSANHMATRTCGNGVCNGTCAPGFFDLNGNLQTDGCEEHVAQFSGDFPGGSAAPDQCADWQIFRSSITSSPAYTKVTIAGSNDPVGVSCTGSTANSLCQALRTGVQFGPVACGGRTWVVSNNCGAQGSVELSANPLACSCDTGYAVRPCYGDAHWGGVNGPTCNAPSQTMTVTCQ